MQAIDKGEAVKQYGKALVLVVFALGVRFVDGTPPYITAPGATWAATALRLALSDVGNVNLENLMVRPL